MDPFARREMWKVISSALEGSSVILTTHFMEEVIIDSLNLVSDLYSMNLLFSIEGRCVMSTTWHNGEWQVMLPCFISTFKVNVWSWISYGGSVLDIYQSCHIRSIIEMNSGEH
jgi:hypothetical protein